MNFQDLKKIEPAKVYIDIAFGNARRKDRPKLNKQKDRLTVMKTYEFQTVQTVADRLVKSMDKIIKSFPRIDTLPEFYLELIRETMDYVKLKKSLGAVNWAHDRIKAMGYDYQIKIKKSREINRIVGLRKEFYGRVSSVMRQIDKDLKGLDSARVAMKRFPHIKTGMFTVAFCGYPNVGKSSILGAISTAKPKIRDYAFTTQDLNVGYLEEDKIQLVDTPGTLDRSNMNDIEMKSILVLRHVADLVVFVMDPTEQCGYDMNVQKGLLRRVKKFSSNIVIVHNKSDLNKNQEKSVLNISTKDGSGLERLVDLIKYHKTHSKRKDNKD